ncbi:MAG: hypothetical protein JRG82_01170 [Deltaproteobacteria bacterium]|nr:hypothetical protein [Deltaproteobacteria bacterium]
MLTLPSPGLGQTIDNTAFADYSVGGTPVTRPSNLHSIPLGVVRTDATLELWRYAPGAAGSTALDFSAAECSPSGAPAGPFNPAPGPFLLTGAPIALGTLDMLPGARYALGEAAFLRVADGDQNADSLLAEMLLVSVSASGTGDSVLVRLRETGPDTGDFTGWVQTSSTPDPCMLEGERGGTITADYVDAADGTDTESASATIQPLSIVFDTSSGDPISGAVIRLVEEPAGIDASPLGDDGVSPFPASITSGGTETDGSKIYVFDPGTYRYPWLPAGTYRLEVTPPSGYVYPSTTDTATIQALTGAPFRIVTGSRGETFTLSAASSIDIDLPLDSEDDSLFLSITANRDVVGIGDFLQYDVRVRNPGTATAPTGMTLTVTLPVGFRYQAGTSTIDGTAVPDPTVGPKGRTLDFVLPAIPTAAMVHVRLVADVTTSAPLGDARAHARSTVSATLESHTATETVLVQEDLFSTATFILGQVAMGACGRAGDDPIEGVAGIRVYLEDGTFAVSDSRGMYQFEGLEPGTHVVQIDTATLPVGMEMDSCAQNTRWAGRNFSQFVDVQGGTLWRADFALRRRAPASGYVNHQLSSAFSDGILSYEVEMRGSGVPVRRLSSIVVLPEGVVYEPGSSAIDGAPLADPPNTEHAVVHRLEDADGKWTRRITFRARLTDPGLDRSRLVTKSFANFETPSERNQRTPEGTTLAFGAGGSSRSASGVKTAPTLGLRPGQEWKPASTPVSEQAVVHDGDWLETADAQLRWVAPGPDFSPKTPNTNPLIVHSADHELQIRVNGNPVNPAHLDSQRFDKQGRKALSQWRGLDLREGPNVFEVRALDADGIEVDRIERSIHYPGGVVDAQLVPEASHLVADGRKPIVVAVRLTDRWGQPAREDTTGTFGIEGGYESLQEHEAFDSRVLAGLAPERPEYTVGPDGVARLELAPSSESGSGSVWLHFGSEEPREIRFWVEAEERDWIVVGLGEGTVSHSSFSGDDDGAEDRGFDPNWGLDQRMSIFAKGPVAPNWLLTFSYDTEGTSGDPESLQGDVDPDAYYQLYGSRSQQDWEAPTSNRFYAKLERKNFYAMYGDYETHLDSTELSTYNRALTGFKTEYEGERLRFRGFASQTDHAYVRDELRGDGTSGLYRLTRSDIVVNSDRITIEIRDRFQTERVLSTETLTRNTDYDIDYGQGTVWFRRPIQSKRGFDPVFIVAEYESDDDRDDSIVTGGRGSVRTLDDRMEFGATAIHEGNEGQNGELFGADFRYDIDSHTSLRAEYAWSNTERTDGGEDGSAYLAEIVTSHDRLDARAYVREQQADFGLGQQSGTETATRKLGVDGRLRLNDQFSVEGEAYRQTNLENGADRDAVDARLQFHEGNISAYTGMRWARDRLEDDDDAESSLLLAGASYEMLDRKLRFRADSELALGGGDENVDNPARLIFGADYDITSRVTAFAEHEFSFGEIEDAHGTRAGLRTRPWSGATADTSIEQQVTESGERLFANLGLTQSWQVNDRWSVDASLDRTATLRNEPRYEFNADVPPTSGTIDDDFTAVSLGSTYRTPRWSWTGRIENRLGERADKLTLFTGFYQEIQDGIGYSVGLDLSSTRADDGADTRLGKLDLGFVYRPLGSRWVVLDRTELTAEENDGEFDFESRRLVNNLHVNFKWSERFQVSMQYGAKYLLDQIDGENVDGYIDLWGLEFRRDLNDRWDFGGHARIRSSWKSDLYDTALGVSLGYKIVTNLWVSVGYNFAGFRDDDFSDGNYTSKGAFIKFRYKLDQQTIKDLLDHEPAQ